MSDSYEAIVVPDIDASDAPMSGRRVINRLIQDQIVSSELELDAVLGANGGYRPDSRISEVYHREPTEGEFWSLQTCGMEVITERWFNFFGTTVLESIRCPHCDVEVKDNTAFMDEFGEAIGNYLESGEYRLVSCPSCRARVQVSDWKATPHLGFCNLAFLFWNWPPLEHDSWKIRIDRIVKETLDRSVVLKYGRV